MKIYQIKDYLNGKRISIKIKGEETDWYTFFSKDIDRWIDRNLYFGTFFVFNNIESDDWFEYLGEVPKEQEEKEKMYLQNFKKFK